jgi:Crinkler effector protein N-terminal domain
MTDVLELNCLVLGQDSSHIFLIRIPANQTVYDVKKAIREEKKPTFREVNADDLQLFKVSIPVDHELDEILADFQPQHDDPNNNVQKLSAVDELIECFPSRPVRKHLHIIVQPPHFGESDPSFRTIFI